MNEEEVIERLNRFKTIKVLYGNTFSMHLEQLEQLQNDIETVLSELEKKEKQIDLMAKEIYECNEYIDNEFERELKFKSVEDVKQYFTKKVEGK